MKDKIKLFSAFLLPTLMIYGIFVIYPIFATFYYSFYEWTGLTTDKVFIGFKNYTTLFSDSNFLKSIQNNLWVVFSCVFIQIPMGLSLALIISRELKRVKFYKIIYFLPFLLSTVAIGLTWSFLYDPIFGIINKFLSAIGFDTSNLFWLANETTALIAILIVVIWNYAPFYMILFNASLSTIPDEYYEASSIDGASTFQKFSYITLPLLIPAIMNSVVLSIVGSLKSFDLFYVMTKGGPSGATELMGTYMYKQGFTHFKMGYASAVAFAMLFMTMCAMILIQCIQKKITKEMSN